jgi:hypothetical protein
MKIVIVVLVALSACAPRFWTYNPANGCMSVSPNVVQCPSDTPRNRYCISFRDDHGRWRGVCTDQTESL